MDHRARPSEISSLYISGDVDVTSIGFNTTLSKLKSDKGVTLTDESDWVDLAEDAHTSDGRLETESPVPEDSRLESARKAFDPQSVSLKAEELLPHSGSDLEVSQKDSGYLNGQFPALQTVEDSAVCVPDNSEMEAVRDRVGSVTSDIFLSAQHSLEPSISSNRNSLNDSHLSKIKTDDEEKLRKS